MTIDIASLLAISGNSMYNTATTKQQTSSSDFNSMLMNVLSGQSTTVDENPLYTVLTSATNTDIYAQDSSSTYMDYLAQYNGSASSIEGYLSNYTNNQTNGEQVGNSLMASFQSQMLDTLTAAKANLEKNASTYAEKIGTDPSEAAKSRYEQMQNNVSILSDFISQKQQANTLLNQLNSTSSMTQFLLNKNQTTSLL